MGTVIDLTAFREARDARERDADDASVSRLDRAMRELEGRVGDGGALHARHETDLLAISGALALGMFEEAAERIERLAVRVAHPAERARRESPSS